MATVAVLGPIVLAVLAITFVAAAAVTLFVLGDRNADRPRSRGSESERE